MSEDNMNMDTASSCSSINDNNDDSDAMYENNLHNNLCDTNSIQDRLNYKNMSLIDKRIENSVSANNSSLNLSTKCLINKNSGTNKFTIDNILGLEKRETSLNSNRLDDNDVEYSEEIKEKSEFLSESNLSFRDQLSEYFNSIQFKFIFLKLIRTRSECNKN